MSDTEGKDAAAYFVRRDDGRFMPTVHASGAWNITEQHVGPGIGLLAHAIEQDQATRRAEPLQIARLSYDIWGTMPMEPVEIELSVPRPGRTIELVEARLCQGGRPAIVVRAWLIQAYDSAGIARAGAPAIPPPEAMPPWQPSSIWAGAFIGSLEARRQEERTGRARCWVRAPLPLLAGESVSGIARAMGLVDIANGMSPLASPDVVAFPNLDLTAHLFRPPTGSWIGFDVTVSAGSTGLGVTQSILHDEAGPWGAMAQSLTIRPRG